MTNDELHETIVRWIARVTGRTTIKAYQSGPRPAQPYIMVNMTGTARVRENEQAVEYTPDRADEPPPVNGVYPDITAAPVIETEWRFSVHGYGGEQSTDLLRPIESARRLSQILEPVYPDLIVFDTSAIRSVPEWVNNVWEHRANIDLFVRGLTRDGFVISTIDGIEGFIVTREGST